MRARELNSALAEECRTTAGRIEDTFAATFDILADRLAKGETVTLGKIGTFELRPLAHGDGSATHAIRFRPLVEMRERLKLAEPRWEPTDICPECRARPRKKENLCAVCRNARRDRRQRKRQQA